jgi:hypothetical protein
MDTCKTMASVTEYRLSFCNLCFRDDDIAILEIDDGVEVDAAMVREISALADDLLDRPIGLISNRKHSYSLSFDTMTSLARSPYIAALAIVVYSSKSKLLVEIQNRIVSAIQRRPIRVFTAMDEAVDWLHAQRRHTLETPENTTSDRY